MSMTHGGAATAVFFGYYTMNDIAAAVGILCSVAGLVFSWYWKQKYYEMDKNRLQWDRRRMIRRGTPEEEGGKQGCTCAQDACACGGERKDGDE